MAAVQLSERTRRRLADLVAEDRPDPAALMGRLCQLREEEGLDACSGAVHLLAHIRLPESQAEQLLRELLEHRERIRRALRRDPGLRVSAVDYLSNVKKLLVNPTIVERAQLERTERSAITDALTRLYNRRYFSRVLALEVRRSHRYSLRLSLLMLDVDAFKTLNDTYGHPFGDRVLQQIGRNMRRAVRDADVPCRYGGEEFAVVLPETDRLGAYAVAQRIRRRVSRGFAEGRVGGESVPLTLSGGIASYPRDGTDPRTLVARADQALYRSKRQGKDRISLYHSERRVSVRYPVRATVRAVLRGADGTDGPSRPIDLSRSGALVDLEQELAPGASVELTFAGRDAAGRPRDWIIGGAVVRTEPRRGGGPGCRAAVAFDRLLEEECLFQQVLRSRARATTLRATR